jgi:hypothetical protein
MPLLSIDNIENSTDLEGRLTATFKVVATEEENVETVKTAYVVKTQIRLPQKGDPNELRTKGGKEMQTRFTVVDDVRVTHRGEDWNTYDVVVTYLPPDEAASNDKDTQVTGKQIYPWNEPPSYTIEGDSIQIPMYGADYRGQPLQYSNGDSIILETPNPISIISITRNVLVRERNSPKLSEDFYQRVNNSTETIQGVKYGPRTLLVQSFGVSLERFKDTDPKTGKTTTVEYYTESIVVAARRDTWAARVLDEGVKAKYTRKNEEGKKEEIMTYRRDNDKLEDNSVQFLNGKGYHIFGDDPDVPAENAETTGKTPQGVVIDDFYSKNSGVMSRTVLALMPYEEKDFSAMQLGRGF